VTIRTAIPSTINGRNLEEGFIGTDHAEIGASTFFDGCLALLEIKHFSG
jgi:hypothetical protein